MWTGRSHLLPVAAPVGGSRWGVRTSWKSRDSLSDAHPNATRRRIPMSSWTPGELDRIGRTDELDLASERRDGSLRDPVTMWVVRDRDDLYVRSMYGPAGAWFRGTQTRRQGHIRSGGVDKDVSFVIDTDPELNDRI